MVIDTDGSAFITKAEFDSLKNNFQAQIDNYNQSIDSKIDGAIASYLAGIKVNTDDKPQFEAFGPDYGPAPHYWMGTKCKFVRLRNVTSSAFGASPTSKMYVENLTRNNDYGIGFCWWLVGYKPSSGIEQMSDEADAYIAYSGYAGQVTKVFHQSGSGSTPVAAGDVAWIANKGLSIKMLSIIGVVKPEIPLIKFYGGGEARLKVWYASDGCNTEAGSKGGSPGDGQYKESGTKLSIKKGAAYTDYTYNKDGWTDLDLNVTPGDFLCLRNTAGQNTVGFYSIFFWSADIAGWEPIS